MTDVGSSGTFQKVISSI